MKPGPPPKPTALITSWRAKKRTGEPRPPKAAPTCPKSLSPAAKKKFRETVKHQQSMGLESPVDRDVVALYADLWTWLEDCRAFLRKHGETYPVKDDAGKVTGFRLFPQVNLSLKLAIQVARLEAELGLTPSGRARLQVNTEPEVAKVSTRPRIMEPVIFAPEAAR